MPGGGGIEEKEAQRSCMYGGVKPCERSKNMGEDTLILGYGTGCGRGGPPVKNASKRKKIRFRMSRYKICDSFVVLRFLR